MANLEIGESLNKKTTYVKFNFFNKLSMQWLHFCVFYKILMGSLRKGWGALLSETYAVSPEIRKAPVQRTIPSISEL